MNLSWYINSLVRLTWCALLLTHLKNLCILTDLLAKFPPSSVAMKMPLSIQPWASSPELVNKLFKVFYSVFVI